MIWQVYMIECSDRSVYTGITTDVQRRMQQHAGGRGAKYFRGRAPVLLIYLECGHDRVTASRREIEIKALDRAAKVRLVNASSNVLTRAFSLEEINAGVVVA